MNESISASGCRGLPMVVWSSPIAAASCDVLAVERENTSKRRKKGRGGFSATAASSLVDTHKNAIEEG
ncbi:hypothetical protein OUZ56_005008 [Daphnia magna]|uniref:Uncharacterized protein n=1 Tax=Daphnia magna TaxID=35525 RepID=A0ABQ9YRH9_9CRUS|nr:hypothetical protein OUZ56_005008 [Daphnia magna]